ncbi:alpha/beta hydrolase [Thermoanaerobacter wiegelii]|uniref:Alpha/beta hydrolase fold protein n=1 Tax=Thermoanaerobacter wiegelii Rt8.B1 TaxID=697303 RepID=G2MW64_9THEO|nr:alpha/beta hydrolase [Thermoanaerobacter wiegelii]AEM77952.1 alpha/beta hydrolase fold protein [Thermoanaerobacter wiegelii Rt8.B1]
MASNYSNFFIKGEDGVDIYVHLWEPVEIPKGIIQIFHGMAEHGGRYGNFARYMNEKGFIVCANDHRGHGKTAGTLDDIGYIGKNGFEKIVEDEYVIMKFLKEKYENLPVVIFGHSFGSFIAQEFMIRHGKETNGVILSGSSAIKELPLRFGYALAFVEKTLFGEKKRSKILDKLTFGSYNKKIKEDNLSKFEWLSTDKEEVKKYEEDPYCGGVFTVGFFYYFFKGLLNLYKTQRLLAIPKDLPLFVISGEEDPVGEYGKLVKRLYELYKSIGLKQVNIKLYPGKRHELLNEVEREKVYEDILTWIGKRVLNYSQ